MLDEPFPYLAQLLRVLFSPGVTWSAGGTSGADPFQVPGGPGGAGEDADGAEPQEGTSGAGAGGQHQCQVLRGGCEQVAPVLGRRARCLPGHKAGEPTGWEPGCSASGLLGLPR